MPFLTIILSPVVSITNSQFAILPSFGFRTTASHLSLQNLTSFNTTTFSTFVLPIKPLGDLEIIMIAPFGAFHCTVKSSLSFCANAAVPKNKIPINTVIFSLIHFQIISSVIFLFTHGNE